MKRSSRNFLILSSLLTLSSAGRADTASRGPATNHGDHNLKFTVRVYNYARVPGETLERAKAEAAAVFRKIKVGTAWVDCALSRTKLPNDPGCNPRRGPTDLVLRIVPRSMTKRYGFRSGVLGFALNTKKSGSGHAAYVFFDRLQGLPGWRSAAEQHVILGHLIAHEIGHLLLGYQKHSLAGLMRPGWDRKQLRQAVNGTLNFSSRQARKVRAAVQDRIRAQQRATSDGVNSGIMRAKWTKNDAKLASTGELLFTRAQGKRIRAQMLERIQAEQDHRRRRPESALSSDRAESKSGIKVRVYNQAGVAERIVAAAKEQAGRVLRNVDVHTLWIDVLPPWRNSKSTPPAAAAHRPPSL